MVRNETRVKAGFDDIYNLLLAKKNIIEEEIRKEVEEKTADIENMLNQCCEVVEVEVPDEEAAEFPVTEEEQVNQDNDNLGEC